MRAGDENRILIIVPAYNEENNVGELIREIRESLLDADIVVIDNASQDKTLEVVRGLGVEVLELPFNLGIGGAVLAGYEFALEMGYDVVIRIDGDGQHPPTEAHKLLEPVLKGEADVAIGSRYQENRDYKPQMLRKFGTTMFSSLVSLMIKQRITDATSGFSVMNRNAIKILYRELPRDYPEIESLVILHKNNLKITEIPVTMKKRKAGLSSIVGWKQAYYIVRVLLSLLIKMREKKKVREEYK